MKQNPLMYAIIGDICGSRFERIRGLHLEVSDLDNVLMHDSCHFTDDTVHTVAVAHAILENPENPNFAKYIRKYTHMYPNAGYGARFVAWANGLGDNNSFGNGAYMRISPVLWAYKHNPALTKAVMAKSIASTHDHPYSYLFIDSFFDEDFDIPVFTESQKNLIDGKILLEKYAEDYAFDATCPGSVPEAIYIGRIAPNYKTAIQMAISLGGDTDTQAAMAGAIYGFNTYGEIPQDLYDWAWDLLPKEFQQVLTNFQKFLEDNGY